MPETDVSKMKVADLKRELKLRGLSIVGNKNELQDRLQTALLEGDISLEDTAISADLLEEDVLTDEDEKCILAMPTTDENDLLKSPTLSSVELSLKDSQPTAESVVSTSTAAGTNQSSAKKILLKRKNSFTTPATMTAGVVTLTQLQTTKENTEPSFPKAQKMSEINPITVTTTSHQSEKSSKSAGIKISQLTMQERLEMRAKKFGVNDKSTEAIATSTTTNTIPDEKQVEMLKKRAERFGCVVSSTIAKIDADEKLLKRKQRFGDVTVTSENKKSDSDLYAEKARLRLERFKTSTNTTSSSN